MPHRQVNRGKGTGVATGDRTCPSIVVGAERPGSATPTTDPSSSGLEVVEEGGPLILIMVLDVIADLEKTLEVVESIDVNEARCVNPGPSYPLDATAMCVL